jgi:hypothetical protein
MKKPFRIVYFANLVVILLALLSPLIEWTTRFHDYNWAMKYYAICVLLSVTFCVPFFGLNVYGSIADKQHRTIYLCAAVFVSGWIVSGVYQLVYAYSHEIGF